MMISGCIITQDSPALLNRCLASIVDLVDELVVIDGEPDDDTLDVALMYDAIYIANKWSDDFSFQRNLYLQAAKGDWILTIDTDEVIRDVVDFKRFESFDGVYFPRDWRTKEGIVVSQYHYPDFQLRFFKKEFARYEGMIHHTISGLTNVTYSLESFIYHDCLIFESREQREAKVRKYEQMCPGSGFPQYYLYEDYPHSIVAL